MNKKIIWLASIFWSVLKSSHLNGCQPFWTVFGLTIQIQLINCKSFRLRWGTKKHWSIHRQAYILLLQRRAKEQRTRSQCIFSLSSWKPSFGCKYPVTTVVFPHAKQKTFNSTPFAAVFEDETVRRGVKEMSVGEGSQRARSLLARCDETSGRQVKGYVGQPAAWPESG